MWAIPIEEKPSSCWNCQFIDCCEKKETWGLKGEIVDICPPDCPIIELPNEAYETAFKAFLASHGATFTARECNAETVIKTLVDMFDDMKKQRDDAIKNGDFEKESFVNTGAVLMAEQIRKCIEDGSGRFTEENADWIACHVKELESKAGAKDVSEK